MQRCELIQLCAKICYYAQQHSSDEECWGPRGSDKLHELMEHTSFVVACFIAQNTPKGDEGVGYEIVQDALAGPLRSEFEWQTHIAYIIKEFWPIEPDPEKQERAAEIVRRHSCRCCRTHTTT